jgi:crossover junction endodeoxyribonuclease RuvC
MADPRVAIGIDPSLTGTAVCFYTPGQATQPHAERYSSKPRPGLDGRIARYEGLVSRIIAPCVEAMPAIILIEGYSYGSKGKAILDIAEFGGLLRHGLLTEFDCPIIEVPPTALKKWATGKGNANKTQVVSAIVRRYGCDYDSDDEYDAFALARMAAQVLGWDGSQTANQSSVVAPMAMGLESEADDE